MSYFEKVAEKLKQNKYFNKLFIPVYEEQKFLCVENGKLVGCRSVDIKLNKAR